MSPLALLPALLVLLCPSLVLASGPSSRPGPTLPWTCGDDQFTILKTSDGRHNVSINGVLVQDRAECCQRLRSYFGSGCLRCDEQSEVWRGAWMHYCSDGSQSSYVTSVPNMPRKLLKQPSENIAKYEDDPCGNMGLHENEQDASDSLEKEDTLLAVPGVLLLCCGLMLPCFHAERKEGSRHNTTSIQRNAVDSLSSFDVSTSSEKVPPTPHRIPPSPSRFAPSPHIARVGSVDLSVQQILRATQNFSSSFKLGEGGFGTVYRAVLSDGQVVAVKRAKKDQFAGPRDEFSNEVELLAKICHRNLVRLLGYTDKGNERIIITEYVPNGTLREHLDGQHGRTLDFNQRLEIAIDVAHALTYLHLYAGKPIIHRDVKSSNILLTDSYQAKVSDFGFARIGPNDTEKTHISTKVKGTAGYLDPEYLRTYQLNTLLFWLFSMAPLKVPTTGSTDRVPPRTPMPPRPDDTRVPSPLRTSPVADLSAPGSGARNVDSVETATLVPDQVTNLGASSSAPEAEPTEVQKDSVQLSQQQQQTQQQQPEQQTRPQQQQQQQHQQVQPPPS